MLPEEKYCIDILHQDNHTIVVNKKPSDLAQGDRTGDVPLSERIKDYLKEKHNKPGNVFCGLVHRLDRPTSGVLLFAKTSKALSRLNKQFREKQTQKIYLVCVEHLPEQRSDTLTNWLVKNEQQNKSYVCESTKKGAKLAILTYRYLFSSEHYHVLEITLQTGRHHQIRCQLAHIGATVKGDVKYGAKRPNIDNSIHLHAWKLQFIHPTTQQTISITAPPPKESLWNFVTKKLQDQSLNIHNIF